MIADWSCLSPQTQLALAGEALRLARVQVAEEAECLASAIGSGTLADRGGVDALRLMAALLRHRPEPLAAAGAEAAAWPACLMPIGRA